MYPVWLRHLPLKQKMMFVVMLTTIAALVISSLAFLGYEFVRYRASLVRNVTSLADIVGANTTAALAFKDPQSAGETLKGLAAESHIVFARIFAADGSAFAGYSRNRAQEQPPLPGQDGHHFTLRNLDLVQAIHLEGKRIGTIYLRSSLREMYRRLLEYAGIFAFVMFASSALAFLLSSRLQRFVSDPILQLAKVANTVSTAKDYSLRATKAGNDEIGILIDGFNDMLAQIESRDDALRKARDGLELRVQERTEQLRREVSERVRYAAELEKALQVKAEFLSVMSHELRTPLNIIMGYANVVLEETFGGVNEGQKNALATILRCSSDLLTMINDIMSATKLEADKLEVDWEEVQPAEILEGLRTLYGVHMKEGVRLEWNFPSTLPALLSDANKIRHILQNLINNALKFTENGSITVTALALEEDGKTSAVRYEVADTGIGIPPEMHSVIFNMFQQVDSTITRSYGGVGLGLYIVKQFTEFLGGSVTVKSQVGEGSTFVVTLPVERKAPEAPAAGRAGQSHLREH
jgi:signal transduction histidine kinase